MLRWLRLFKAILSGVFWFNFLINSLAINKQTCWQALGVPTSCQIVTQIETECHIRIPVQKTIVSSDFECNNSAEIMKGN